jgi:hypothetical protein
VPVPASTVSEAIDCAKGCRVFGAPDLDGDGRAELAVVVVDGNAADSIELYKVVSGDAGPTFRQVTARAHGGPVYFDWGRLANYRAGVVCQYVSRLPQPPLNFWHAQRQEGVWHLVETFGSLQGSKIAFGRTTRSTVADQASLPSGGGGDFCGVPVRP